MKITFVYPAIGISGFNDHTYKYGGETAWISHGLAAVATAASAVATVDLIDMRRLTSWDEFRKVVKKSLANWYGFSISSMNREVALTAIGVVRSIHKNTNIVVGGVDPTMFPEEYKDVLVIKGEGERSISELLGGKKPLWERYGWINREFFDYQKELDFPFVPSMETPMVTMLAGRGCPYNCLYCQPAERVVHGEFKQRDVEDVLGELDYLKSKYDFKSVLFWDDTFAINREWVSKFCEGFKEFKSQLVVNCRSDIISKNEDMIKELKSIGLHMLLVGIESGSQRMLNLIGKGTRISQNNEAARICKEHGVELFATFMLGLPTETSAEALSTMAHINHLRPTYSLPFYYTPIPGTDLYDYCETEGLLLNGSRSIERTGKFGRSIKGVDYDFLDKYIDKARFYEKASG